MLVTLWILSVLMLSIGVYCVIFVANEFLGFLLFFIPSSAIAAALFALRKVLVNQEEIMKKLEALSNQTNAPIPKKPCAKCGEEYEENLSSCPECGWKKGS